VNQIETSDTHLNCNSLIAVAYFNHGHYLKNLLRRISQLSPNANKVIIVDDASRQPIEDSLSKIVGNVEIIRQLQNRGPAAARNVAVSKSDASFLIFVDADNLPRPQMIKVFLETMERTKADLVVSPMRGFSKTTADGEPEDTLFVYTPEAKFDPIRSIQDNNLGDTNFCVRRSVFEALGGFREDRELMGVEDWDFLIRFELAGYKRVVAPEVLIDYRVVPGSLSRRTDPKLRHKKLLESYLAGSPLHVQQLVQEDWLRLHYLMKLPAFRLAQRIQNVLDGKSGALSWFVGAFFRRLNPFRKA
jgi:glycosyltransferase involved in cell wall biosynthesis